ncbi:MAG: flagellin [Candidatus Solibacter sp.]
MISNLNPSSERFLANVERVQRRVDNAARQASSGKRVNVASDGPGEIDTILQLRTDSVHNDQVHENLAVAQSDADAADSALTAAAKIMDRARVLASQGANFTLDDASRQGMAGEVQSLLEQMVAISRTTVQGRYIFGGDTDSAPPYQIDSTSDTGVARLTNSLATRRVEDSTGGSFAVARSASQVFDTRNADDSLAPDNVFAALNGLQVALLANDSAAVSTANASIQQAAGHLGTAQAFYGTVQNRIADSSSYSSSYDVQLKTELSQKEDADITAAALMMTQGTTQLQAAFQMQAKMPRTTLFDFIG